VRILVRNGAFCRAKSLILFVISAPIRTLDQHIGVRIPGGQPINQQLRRSPLCPDLCPLQPLVLAVYRVLDNAQVLVLVDECGLQVLVAHSIHDCRRILAISHGDCSKRVARAVEHDARIGDSGILLGCLELLVDRGDVGRSRRTGPSHVVGSGTQQEEFS